MIARLLLLLGVAGLAACRPSVDERVASPPIILTPQAPSPAEGLRRGMVRLTPMETIMKAADAAPRGVKAVFELPVRRAEQVGPNYFLNSEEDYRDPRNLSISIAPAAQRSLRALYGDDLKGALVERRILVLGEARRVRIDFTTDGRPSGKYYYQTHVRVVDARQIERIPG